MAKAGDFLSWKPTFFYVEYRFFSLKFLLDTLPSYFIATLLCTPRSAHTILNQYTKTATKSPKHGNFVVPKNLGFLVAQFDLHLRKSQLFG
jgi:hypothetical protein